ncbi:hypothetical protein EMIHUDRAFT_351378 [Emiliania huxleyi CCMP1516]|uniref:Uncharacterized protein n=2 Tax=Emiliania huxleyi TaxID=2903 RepID=A0A0D3KUH4_EMIH1|nr:hypothetical protein EMIHUDRAFT_351378 [Emiliania huxleyi CCMP1516]EOD39409.1 hypothetical protein EMIHUDRAFT_351378 [Emiliania huxleyi CCMP1516]|eukprot:XP_005791838.1 hypothetical protein EMIHUDRAFT_351378 [Emiliania huxleyi CCMP1516]
MLSEPQPGMPVLEKHAMPIEPQRQRRSRTMYSAEYKLRVVREALARPQACRIKPTCREHPGIEPTQLRKWIKNIDTLESLAELEARQFEIRRDFHVKNGQKALLGPSAQSGEREIVQREQNAQNPFGLASGMLGTVQQLQSFTHYMQSLPQQSLLQAQLQASKLYHSAPAASQGANEAPHPDRLPPPANAASVRVSPPPPPPSLPPSRLLRVGTMEAWMAAVDSPHVRRLSAEETIAAAPDACEFVPGAAPQVGEKRPRALPASSPPLAPKELALQDWRLDAETRDLVQLPPHSLAPMGSFGGFAPSGPPTAPVPPAASGPLCGADAVEVIAHNAMRAAAAGGSSGASSGEAGGAAPQEWSPPLDCAVPAAEPLGPFEAFCPAAVRSHDGRSPGLPNGAGLVMW